MFKNYLATAWRNILKNKSYILINTLGLGIALACCVTSYILLAFNIEFDNYFSQEDTKDLYRVHTDFTFGENEDAQHVVVPLAMGPAIAEDVAGINRYSRVNNDGGYVRFDDKAFNEGITLADSTFFDLLNYKVVKGDLESFKNLNTIILNEEIAEKYFPDENPINKVLTVNFPNLVEKQFVVGAVVEKVPLNTSIYLSLMVRFEHFFDIYGLKQNDWGDWRDPALILEIPNDQSVAQIEKQLQSYIPLRNKMKEDAKVKQFQVLPFQQVPNQDDVMWSQLNLKISATPIFIFIIMGVIILLIACFNLTNTSVAMASKRFKEIGLRKVVGASKIQIVVQFLFEMVVIVLMALVFGMMIARILADEFTQMWGIPYGLADLNGLNLMIALVILVFMVSILAGIYPSLLSTGFRPISLIKNQARMRGSSWLSKLLVSFQFTLSIIVLINGIVFTQNTKFQEKLDYGFNYKDVLSVNIQDESQYKILKSQILRNPKVKEVAISHHQLGTSSYPFPVIVDTTEYQAQHIEFGENFFTMMGMELSEGRFPDLNNKKDEFESIVVNKTFLTLAGIEDPLNTVVSVRGEKRRIIGVVEDHIDNVYRSAEVEPFVFYASKRYEYHIMLVKSEVRDLPDVKADVESIWKKEFPDKAFMAEFQEELMMGDFRGLNNNMKNIFLFLTILGGVLSIAGIFALSTLHIEKKRKEIGIRKALGGTIQNIVRLLSRDFVIILSIAAVIGGVGGFFLANMLLDEIYAYHIQVKVLAVILGVVIVCVSGLATTSGNIFRAARVNPVKSLRDE